MFKKRELDLLEKQRIEYEMNMNEKLQIMQENFKFSEKKLIKK